MPVQAASVIAIVIDLPSFLLQKFRQEIRLIVTESNFNAVRAARFGFLILAQGGLFSTSAMIRAGFECHKY
jgi:hypothetical protein